METKSVWEQVKRIAALSMTPAHAGTPKIYANGRHQAIVDVHLTAVAGDAQGSVINVPVEDLIEHVELVDYETGERLGGGSSESWGYSTRNHGYPVLSTLGVIESAVVVRHGDETTLRLYVTCSPNPQMTSLDIAVAVTLANGKRVSTCRREMTSDHAKVSVTTVPAIDYSKPELWSITEGDFENVINDLNCPYRTTRRYGPKWHDKFVGVSRSKKISIKCATLPDSHEIKTKPNYGHRYAEISSRGIARHVLKFINKVDAFSGWNSSAGFHLMAWSIDPLANFGIRHGGKVALTSTDWIATQRLIVIGEHDYRHERSPVEARRNEFNIYVWDLFVPESNLKHAGWGNETGIRNVQIEDNFGNESILKIRFDDDSFAPKLID